MEIDVKLLVENLEKIPEEENILPESRKRLKLLLLVLAGDQRVIQDLSLEEVEELFSETPSLLSIYNEDVSNYFNENMLENYSCFGRRAV